MLSRLFKFVGVSVLFVMSSLIVQAQEPGSACDFTDHPPLVSVSLERHGDEARIYSSCSLKNSEYIISKTEISVDHPQLFSFIPLDGYGPFKTWVLGVVIETGRGPSKHKNLTFFSFNNQIIDKTAELNDQYKQVEHAKERANTQLLKELGVSANDNVDVKLPTDKLISDDQNLEARFFINLELAEENGVWFLTAIYADNSRQKISVEDLIHNGQSKFTATHSKQ